MNYLDGNKKNFLKKFITILGKRRLTDKSKISSTKKIIQDIKINGDKALIKYEKKFSKLKSINRNKLIFNNKEIKQILKKLDRKTKKSIDLAFTRIFNFHKKQTIKEFSFKDKFKNDFRYYTNPINRIGVYVPGGTASYPSTVLMNCIPALIAGVKEIYMTTPCLNKSVNPAIIYAAKKCKVRQIYKVGGAQAIASFAYGTKKIKKVDKIVGPGNEYVAIAKKEVFGDVGIDMVAGPSEVTILADKSSNPNWVAADLIAQAEHDKIAQSILISNNKEILNKVKLIIKKQLSKLPKKNIAQSSLKKFGYLIFCRSQNDIINLINEIAPEHLELFIRKPEKIQKRINNAGSIFLGKYSPEAIGDYLAGPNHVLPTSGSSKFSSGLAVYDFLKRHSAIKISKSGIERLGPSVINLAEYENLEGHSYSVKLRLKRI